MKKVLSVLLILILMLSLAACVEKKNETPGESVGPIEPVEPEGGNLPEGGMLLGGWNVNAELPACELPAEVKEAFEKAMEGYTGMGFVPVVYLGAEADDDDAEYALLCEAAAVIPNAVPTLKIVAVEKEKNGSCRLEAVRDLPLADLAGNALASNTDRKASDDWKYYGESPAAELEERVREGFEAAFAGTTDAQIRPLALLATQVVAGTNYAMLCSCEIAGVVNLHVYTIYHSFDGTAEVLSARIFDLDDILD